MVGICTGDVEGGAAWVPLGLQGVAAVSMNDGVW
jgi:hypothetical protein